MKTEEPHKTNFTFLFAMVGVELLLILIVFFVERYYKSRKRESISNGHSYDQIKEEKV